MGKGERELLQSTYHGTSHSLLDNVYMLLKMTLRDNILQMLFKPITVSLF